MMIVSTLRRVFPLLVLVGFLSGFTSCLVATKPTGQSSHGVHNKHAHRHCHAKPDKRHKKHKKHQKQVCHKHPHAHPHH